MTIDNTPAIRAFVEERIKVQQGRSAAHPQLQGPCEMEAAIVRELQMIITLCDGLTKQNELLTKAIGL